MYTIPVQSIPLRFIITFRQIWPQFQNFPTDCRQAGVPRTILGIASPGQDMYMFHRFYIKLY